MSEEWIELFSVTSQAIKLMAFGVFISQKPAPGWGHVGTIIIESGVFKDASAGEVMEEVRKVSEYLYGERLA